MTAFIHLPTSTIVDKVVPKNSFDSYTSPRQRKLFSVYVEKIKWANKLSPATTNLHGKDILEIELFDVVLKKKGDISELLTVIDRAIPYPIVFFIKHETEVMISASQKHLHPVKEDNAVIDWTFCSGWVTEAQIQYTIELTKDLDTVFQTFCRKIIGAPIGDKITFADLIAREKAIKELNYQITMLSAKVRATKQFNQKVDLNLELQNKLRELQQILNV